MLYFKRAKTTALAVDEAIYGTHEVRIQGEKRTTGLPVGLYKFFEILNKIYPAKDVHAHCDIPCGIYSPEPSVTAAKTVVKMIEKIQELTPPDFQNADGEAMKGRANSMTRFIMVKEEHAQICKEQLLILWTDYFKPEHLEMFSDLHDTFWKAAKLCSKNKQEISMEAAQELLKTVEGIADMFQKAEDAKAK